MARTMSWACVMCLLAMPLSNAAAQQGCPPNLHEESERGSTVYCKCNSGFENRGGDCKPIPTMRQGPQTIMRQQTKAECVRGAGEQLQQDLSACRSPLVSCLAKAGVRRSHVTCAVALLLSKADRKAKAFVTVLGALNECSDIPYDIADVCESTWGTCQDEPLRKHQKTVAACP